MGQRISRRGFGIFEFWRDDLTAEETVNKIPVFISSHNDLPRFGSVNVAFGTLCVVTRLQIPEANAMISPDPAARSVAISWSISITCR